MVGPTVSAVPPVLAPLRLAMAAVGPVVAFALVTANAIVAAVVVTPVVVCHTLPMLLPGKPVLNQ